MTVITGGAGFIGSHLADRLLRQGRPVLIVDNLSRSLVANNLEWLRSQHGSLLQVMVADVRDEGVLNGAIAGADAVFHLAAQASMSADLSEPAEDLEVNAVGTLRVLEAVRRAASSPPLLFASSSLVYAPIPKDELVELPSRYEPRDPRLREHGIAEHRPVVPTSPFGWSKGTADRYVLDYARLHGVRAVVLRLGCVYGPRQVARGDDGEGPLAYFLMRSLQDRSISIAGTLRQLKDLLYVDDAVSAMQVALDNALGLQAGAFNVGGGPENTASAAEIIVLVEQLRGVRPEVSSTAPRPGDLLYYVTDNRAFSSRTGWQPRVGLLEGAQRLHAWLAERPARPVTHSGNRASA